MPVTFPAHQAAVLPAKIRWPDRFDGTALCVGAAVPDLTYPLMSNQGQTLVGGLVVAVPVTIIIVAVLRWRAANGLFANLPDLGPWRLHSYRVITARRPPGRTTLSSAVLGVVSHVVIDSVTHERRLLARVMGLGRVLFHLPRIHDVSIALLLQLTGHVLGTVLGLWLLWIIGSRRLLEEWYGTGAVDRARRFDITPVERCMFWATVIAFSGLGYVAFRGVDTRWVFKLLLGATVGCLTAGSLTAQPGSRSR